MSEKEPTDKKPLNELRSVKLSWAGKLFFAGIAAQLAASAMGGSPKLPIKIKGSKEQIQAIMSAITSSTSFQKEISKPGATIESVIEKLRLKNLSRDNFKSLTGKDWPL